MGAEIWSWIRLRELGSIFFFFLIILPHYNNYNSF
nr:MAG TPA: hypothetical protein [Caudoviricetes sp.]